MNYYQATEKKPEHGGGWVFMGINRRTGAHIECSCTWDDPGHVTASEADRCFWDLATRNIKWSKRSAALRCKICDEWTDALLGFDHRLMDHVEEPVCHAHFVTSDLQAAEWLRQQHPFKPGMQMIASW